MSHDVVWTVHAFRRLERIWDESHNREAIAHAIDRIEEDLTLEAGVKGESRPEGLRVHFVAPLAVVFWANERTTEVEIVDVWAFRSTT